MNKEQAAAAAMYDQLVQVAKQQGGAVQTSAFILRKQADTAMHSRARRFCSQAADTVDFIAKQPGCTFQTDHGMIVAFVQGLLGDPNAAAAFVKAAPSLVELAKVIAYLDTKHGRSVRSPDWLVTTPDGRATVDPARLSSEPAFFNDEAREDYEKGKDPEMPVDPTAAGASAYRSNTPRSSNPLTVSGGRAAWFAAWDAALAEDEGGAAAPAPTSTDPVPTATTAPKPNRAQRRKKAEKTP